MDDAKIKKLKKIIKDTFGFDDAQVQEWWDTKQTLFNDKSPSEMVHDFKNSRKLEILINFSLKDFYKKELD